MKAYGLKCLLVGLFIAVAGPACVSKKERCTKCGMIVEEHPRWIAGLKTADGKEKRFCSPRCMFAWSMSEQGKDSRDAWVTEYYSQKRVPASGVFFVMGSDVVGPMGSALVPVAGREEAERFRDDHAGVRILVAGEITPGLLKQLKGKHH